MPLELIFNLSTFEGFQAPGLLNNIVEKFATSLL